MDGKTCRGKDVLFAFIFYQENTDKMSADKALLPKPFEKGSGDSGGIIVTAQGLWI